VGALMNSRMLITILALSSTTLSASAAGEPIRHPSCPAYKEGVSWRDYLSGKIPRIAPNVGNGAVVIFDKAKAVNHPTAMGNLPTNVCYDVVYVTAPAGFYSKAGYTSSQRLHNGRFPPTKHGLDGDPNKYKVNVFGVKFLFNDSGELTNSKGEVVGQLLCYFPSAEECAKH
jgi:hypothetical protein